MQTPDTIVIAQHHLMNELTTQYLPPLGSRFSMEFTGRGTDFRVTPEGQVQALQDHRWVDVVVNHKGALKIRHSSLLADLSILKAGALLYGLTWVYAIRLKAGRFEEVTGCWLMRKNRVTGSEKTLFFWSTPE